MAAPGQQPWSNDEKNYLLAEIIKAASPPPGVLLNVITSMSIRFNWDDIPLPPGRSLNQCRFAYDDLRRMHPTPLLANPMGAQTPSPMTAPMALGKRPLPYEPPFAGRSLAPKPQQQQSSSGAYSAPSSTDQPAQKKRRGRPPKIQAQSRSETQQGLSEPPLIAPRPQPGFMAFGGVGSGSAVRPDVYPPLRPPPESQTPNYPPPETLSHLQPPFTEVQAPVPSVKEEAGTSLPPTQRLQISSIITTPGPASASHSSSSSGRRRRRRSMRAEGEESVFSVRGEERDERPEYVSPYASLPIETQDTPARAAVLRHRDQPASDPGPSQPERTGRETPSPT